MALLRRHRGALLLAAVVMIGFGLRVWGLVWGLHDADVSRRAQPDEWVVYWVFRWFVRHQDLNPCPGTRQVLHQQCFYDWGGLYLCLSYGVKMALTPILSLIPAGLFGSHADHEYVRAVLAGRILSVAASTVTILVVYWAGVVMQGARLGIIAATCTALCGLLVQLAHFATPDSTTILFMTLTLLAALYAVDQPSLTRFALMGAVAGLATGSEYNMIVLVLPIVGAWVLSGRRDWRLLAVAATAMAGAWLVVNPYALLQPAAFINANLHSLRLRTVESSAQYQDRWSAYGPAILFVIRFPLGYGVGFAITAWLVTGAVWGLIRRDRYTTILLLWVIPYFILITISPAKFMRYSAPLLPPLTLLAARFLLDAMHFQRARLRIVVVPLALTTALYSLVYDAAYTRLFAATDPRQAATIWLQKHAARHAAVGFEEIPNGLLNLPYFVTDAGFRPCFSTFQTGQLRGPARYFVLDDYALEEHPAVDMSAVEHFRESLQRNAQYRRVFHIQPVPSLFGIDFPIAGSPHDWRYPSHTITVFWHTRPGVPSLGQCYPNLSVAQKALYVPPPDSVP